MGFVRSIHIEGKSIDDVFRLPCVSGVRKDIFGAVFFDLYGFIMHDGESVSAVKGDWLCEDSEGKWSVVRE